MLQKVGRWLSGRVQGTKGVQKYDKYMKENPWARAALGAGDLALAFYGPGMIGKGLQKVGGMGKLAGTGVGRAATSAGNFLAGAPGGNEVVENIGGKWVTTSGRATATPGIMQRGAQAAGRGVQALGRGARAAGRFAMANPTVTGAVLQAAPALAQQNLAAKQSQQMNQLMTQDAQRRLAQREELMALLRPLFVQLQQGG